jgi:hypothetical protein
MTSKASDTTVFGVAENSFLGTQAYVISDKVHGVTVTFRGTHDLANWLQDLDFSQQNLTWDGVPSSVTVHRGFLWAYNAIRPAISDYIRAACAVHAPGNCLVTVTGHSLGAAQAALCAGKL